MASVLITEDEEDVRDFFEDLLTDVGFDVFTAKDGQEAIDMMIMMQPDLMLVDLMMPRVNGVELIERIKVEKPNMPVIVISGSDDQVMIARATKAGAHVCLPKPLDFEVIEYHIVELLEETLKESKLG